MPLVPVGFTVWLPGPVHRALRALRERWTSRDAIRRNLRGDRDIEWSFVAAFMPRGPGRALDFGPGQSSLGLLAAQRGFDVTCVDREPVQWYYRHPRLHFVKSDLLELASDVAGFDLVINCSTVEHVGLPGRYGVTESRPDGDLEAMARLRGLMNPGATMLLTVPVGEDALFSPLCRVYGIARLPRLLDGFDVREALYWVKDAENRWVQVEQAAALAQRAYAGSFNPLRNHYGLGCFVLGC